MSVNLSNALIVGISSRALFDLAEENRIFETEGIDAYRRHMRATERTLLGPGTGYALIRALLELNRHAPADSPLVEVVVMSQNSPETSARIMHAVETHALGITRYAFTGGESLARYVAPFKLDLFLSSNARDVQQVRDRGGCPTALLSPPPAGYTSPTDQVRFAFDADAVLFSEESELRYKREGLASFHAHEAAERDTPLDDGPFAPFLRKLARLKELTGERREYSPVRLAIVTARNAPAQTRVLTTLRAWDVYVDEAFFLGGLPKKEFLVGFRPHIFFDDQKLHVEPASSVVPAGLVPYASGSPLRALPLPLEPTMEIALTRSPADMPPKDSTG